jgi:hypothetical protein
LFIIYKENALVTGFLTLKGWSDLRDQLLNYREINAKNGSYPRLAFNLDNPLEGSHYAMDDCQTETGSIALLLCGEVRVEDPIQH